MTLKTWSGSAKMREVETHRFKQETKPNQTKPMGSLNTHAKTLNCSHMPNQLIGQTDMSYGNYYTFN